MRIAKGMIALVLVFFLSSCSADRHTLVFHEIPCIKPHKGYHYMTCFPIVVSIDDYTIMIPKDFDTDLASIPRWLWPIMAPSRSDFIPAAILHDYLYTCHNGFGRKEIDDMFYNGLRMHGVSVFRAYQMYWAVRIFGDAHFSAEGTCMQRLYEMVSRQGRCEDIKTS